MQKEHNGKLYIPLRPADYNERLRRVTQGEYIL